MPITLLYSINASDGGDLNILVRFLESMVKCIPQLHNPSLYEWPPMLHFGVSDRCMKIYVSCDKIEILRSRRDLTNAIRPSFCKKTGSLCHRYRQILGAGLECSDLNECD